MAISRLTQILPAEKRGRLKYALYRCECGTEKVINLYDAQGGRVVSCGCYQREIRKAQKNVTHGHTVGGNMSGPFRSWQAMKARCENPKNEYFDSYGGRGIGVCERWQKFENFYADMGNRPQGMSIDRIDNNLGYSPENCRWATKLQQSQNRRNTRNYEYCGESLNAVQLYAKYKPNILFRTFIERLVRGMPVDRAINMPVQSKLGL